MVSPKILEGLPTQPIWLLGLLRSLLPLQPLHTYHIFTVKEFALQELAGVGPDAGLSTG